VHLSFANDAFQETLDALRNLEFNRANESVIKIQDDELKRLTRKLVRVISKNSISESVIPVADGSHGVVVAIKRIINGYHYQRISNPSLLDAYHNFSEAIKISRASGEGTLTQLALIGILNLIKSEIYIGSKQYLPYLEHLKELRVDSVDDFNILLFESVFYSKAGSDMKIDFDYFKSVKKIDSVANLLTEKHPYLIYYFFEKGIEQKLLKNYQESERNFKIVDSLTVNQPFWSDLYNTNLWQMAALKFEEKRFSEAKEWLKISRTVSNSIRDTFFDDRLNAWILEKQGKYDSAYYFLNSSLNYEYKMGAKNNSLETALLSVENETEKLKLDKLTLDNRRKTNQNYLIIAISVLALGALTAVFLQKNTTKKRLLAEQESLLKQERVDNLLKEQELVSIDAMIAGQEKERQRVANELHDDLGSLMATIKLHFDNSKVSKKDTGLQNAQKLLDQAYQKVRSMAHSKNSGVMSDQGLLPAIKKMAQVITETNALEVAVEAFGMGDRLENSLELNLFRMVQELVANTIKHAEATKVTIQLTQHEDNLNIIIEDNGKGFDRSKIETDKTGMGLTTIEKRVEHLEGNFTIDSILGKGTSILIDIPV